MAHTSTVTTTPVVVTVEVSQPARPHGSRLQVWSDEKGYMAPYGSKPKKL